MPSATDIDEFYWVVWIDRETGNTGSTKHANADEAWDYADSVNNPASATRKYVAHVVGLR